MRIYKFWGEVLLQILRIDLFLLLLTALIRAFLFHF